MLKNKNEEKRLWAEFLKKACTDLHNQKTVISSAKKLPPINQNIAYQRIIAYIDRLEKLFSNEKEYDEKTYERLRNRIFELICEQTIIKPENIKEEVYIRDKKLYYDRYGQEPVNSTDYIIQKQQQIIENQKNSLREWYNYLCSKDNSDVFYPAWFRFYAFTGAINTGAFDIERKTYKKRDEHTTVIFPELDRETLALTYEIIKDYVIDNKEINEQYRELINVAKQYSFHKLYSAVINYLEEKQKDTNINSYEGIWKKYNQGNTGKEAERLVNDIRNYRTGWCTAGIKTSQDQLQKGDFYVYYVINSNTNELIPKIAIRMENDMVAEVRGTDKNQNIYDSKLMEIAKEKYMMLPGGEKYEKAEKNVKKLMKIYEKQYVFDKKKETYVERIDKEELTREELIFLYDIEEKFVGFGYGSDERIKQLLKDRNVLTDLSIMKVNYFPRDLVLGEIKKLQPGLLPKVVAGEIIGDFYLDYLTELQPGLLPKKHEGINGILSLNGIKKLQFRLFTKKTKIKELYLNSLEELYPGYLSKDVIKVIKVLYLNSLKKLYPESLPEDVVNLYANSLEELYPGCLPKDRMEILDLNGLKKLYVESLPKRVSELYLNSLNVLNPGSLSQQIGDLYIMSVTQIMPGYLPKGFNCKRINANENIKRQLEKLMIESEEYYKQLEEERNLAKAM